MRVALLADFPVHTPQAVKPACKWVPLDKPIAAPH